MARKKKKTPKKHYRDYEDYRFGPGGYKGGGNNKPMSKKQKRRWSKRK